MTKHAYARMGVGEPMAGVVVVPEDLAIGIAIEELLLLLECCEAEDLENQVKYVPI